MFSYAVHELRFSEDAALKRIQAARTARQYPAIFDAVADGRLHLSGVNLLAPHLTAETVDELLADATHKTKSEIESLLACRFPKPDVPTRIAPVAPPSPPVAQHDLDGTPVAQHAPGHVESLVPRDKVSPLSAERVALQLTMRRSTHEKILYAQALLSHQLAHGDIAGVIDRALDALIATLEKRRFAATETPRMTRRSSEASPRYVPAHVKRAVWERDTGQCTFVGDTGKRCPARSRLEFDHVLEVARGGRATLDGIRLRCRAHNQYTAECAFGAAFMQHKREQARANVAHATQRTREQPTAGDRGAAKVARARPENDVAPWLERLGYRAADVRQAIAFCDGMPDATLEDRVRAALGFLRPASGRRQPPDAIG